MSILRKPSPIPAPWLCVLHQQIAFVVMMDEMGKKAPRERRGIQVDLGPWACLGGKGWALVTKPETESSAGEAL